MTGFVVNIDLSAYFEDLRKYACVFVDSSHCKNVGDVEKHIKLVFKLEDNICLTTNLYAEDFLIPRSEDIKILKEHKVFKVQKCDFYDHQVHGTQVKIACDQTALNLIHSDRTIDLSCRPKQRLKLSNNHTNCMHDSQLHILISNNEIKKSNQDISNLSHIQTKEKQKHAKRKCDLETGGHAQNDILDMSFKKSKIKYYDNCFSDSLEINNDLDLSRNNEGTHECHKKPKKRKHCSNDKEDIDLSSSCWNTWVPDGENVCEQHFKKTKETKINHIMTETNRNLRMNTDSPLENDAMSPLKKKRKKGTKQIENVGSNCEDNCNTSINQDVLSTHIKSKKKSKKKFEHSEEPINTAVEIHDENTLKTVCQNGIGENTLIDKCVKLSAQSNPCGTEQEVTAYSYHNNDQSTNVEAEYSNSYSDYSGTNRKRTRVRKHNKTKKKEKMQCLTSVGTLMNRLSLPQENPLPQSAVAKHVFFNSDDLIEQVNGSTESMASNINVSKDEASPTEKEIHNRLSEDHGGDSLTTKRTTWADELLKLSNNKSKPIIFNRVPPSPLVEQNCESASNLQLQLNAGKNSSVDCIEKLSSNHGSHELLDRQSNSKCNGEMNTMQIPDRDTVCKISTTEVKSTSEGLQTFAIDTDNISLTNYPIIDKVVDNDIILFKLLKMNDTEPGVSKTILAKVKGTSHFPDKISLQIMGGCGECEHHLPESSDFSGAEKREFTLEFRWIDLLEPRLFYP